MALRRSAEAKLEEGQPPPPMALDPKRLEHELQVHQLELEMQNEELRAARAALESSLARYTDLYEFSPAGYFTLNRQAEITAVNLTGAQLLGVHRAALIDRPLTHWIDLDDQVAFDTFISDVFEQKLRATCEVVVRRVGARNVALQLTGAAADDGQTCNLAAIDVTERRKVEAEKVLSHTKYRTLFESSNDAVLLLGENGVIDSNPAAVRAFGARSVSELHGLGLEALSAAKQAHGGELMPLAKEHLTRAHADGSRHFEWVFQKLRAGDTFGADVVISRMVLEGREVLQLTIRDTTERTTLRNAAAQAERLASMGMLAAGVAHEINNPLTFVMMNLESVVQDLPPLNSIIRQCLRALRDEVGEEAFAQIAGTGSARLEEHGLDEVERRMRETLSGADRIREIARGLGSFARVERAQLEPINIQRSIELAINLARNQLKYRAQLVTEFNRVPPIIASEGKVAQVILNLLINAVHAIGEGHIDSQRVTVRLSHDENHVCVEVTDTGPGIAPEDLGRIFEPFYSTKAMNEGSGLGLAICRNIVTELGGDIGVESTLGRGTRFLVRFPVVSSRQPLPPVAATRPTPTRRGRLLIIDDETHIRSSLGRLFRDVHEVVLCASAAEGRRAIETNRGFDVILCDLMMPESTGMDLHQWLTAFDPSLAAKVIFITGGAFTPEATAYLATSGTLEVAKPFDTKALKALVADRMPSA